MKNKIKTFIAFLTVMMSVTLASCANTVDPTTKSGKTEPSVTTPTTTDRESSTPGGSSSASTTSEKTYIFESFVWTNFTAKAIYVNEVDDTDIKRFDAVVTSAVTKEATCTEDGIRTYTATYDGHTDTKTETLTKLGHNYGTATYVWVGDKCTAKRVCLNNSTHVEEETVTGVYTKVSDATCTENEKGKYVATFTNSVFEQQESNEIEIENTALEHDYSVFVEFVWDGFTAKAKYKCSRDTDTTLYNAEVESEVTTPATCTVDGVRTYTATYDGHTDTKIEVIPMTGHAFQSPTYTWDGDKCTAKRVCSNDPTHIEEETVTAVYSKVSDATCTENEQGKYTATFTNTAFTAQVINHEKENTAFGHSFGAVDYVWNGDKCTATRTCNNNPNHYETETVTAAYTKTSDATCTEKEKGTYTATFINPAFVTQTTNAEIGEPVGHDYTVFVKFIWTNYDAVAEYKCSNCDSTTTYQATITSEITTQPTATQPGVRTYTATYDGHTDTKEEAIDPLGNDYEFKEFKWTGFTAKAVIINKNDITDIQEFNAVMSETEILAATCTATGTLRHTATYEYNSETYTESKDETTAALGHEYVFDRFDWATDHMSADAIYVCSHDSAHTQTHHVTATVTSTATCTTAGTKTYTVSYDGHTDTYQVTDPAFGHDFNEPTYVWTKTASGYDCTATRICKHDSNHQETETVSAVVETVLASSTTPGSTTYTVTFTNTAFATAPKVEVLYYVCFHDNDGNAVTNNELFNIVEDSTVSFTSYKVGNITYKNPIISTSGNYFLTYVFQGWYVEGTTELVNLNNYKINENTIFKPKYVKYEVKKNIEAAGELPGNQLKSDYFVAGSKFNLSALTNYDYVFLGWFRTVNGTTVQIVVPEADNPKLSGTYTLNDTSDTIIEARWMPMPVVITYGEGSSSSCGTINLPTHDYIPNVSWFGETETFSVTTNNGYLFAGFFNSSKELVYKDANNLPVTSFNVTMDYPMDDITLTAKWVASPITVSVNNTNYGTISGFDGSGILGETREITASPKAGYSFDGWYKNNVLIQNTPVLTLILNDANSGTYEARFTSYKLTTNISLVGAGTITQYNNTVVEAGTSVTVTATPADGYTFIAWYSGETLKSSNTSYTFTMPQSDLVLTAKFEVYTLSMVNMNEDMGSINHTYDEEKTRVGTNIQFVATPKAGYSFDGWYDSATNQIVSPLASWTFTMPNENISYYAKFTYYRLTIIPQNNEGSVLGMSDSNAVEVQFDSNGGNSIDTQYVTTTNPLVYPEYVYKAGYVFNGWYKDALLTERFDFTQELNDNITLHAGWTEMLNDNPASAVAIDSTIYTSGDPYVMNITSTSENSTNNIYFAANRTGEINIRIRVTSNNVNLKIINIKTNTILKQTEGFASTTFTNNNFNVEAGDVICIKAYGNTTGFNLLAYVTGNSVPDAGGLCGSLVYNNTKISNGDEVTLTAVPNEGYSFVGWFKNEETSAISTNEAFTFTMGNQDATYTAKFTSYKFTLNAVYGYDDSNAGTIVTPFNEKAISYNEDVELIVTLNTGYTFLGFFVNNAFISNDLNYTFKMPKIENYVMEARFTYFKYTIISDDLNMGTVMGDSSSNYITVTFNMNGANETYDPQVITKTTPITYPGNPTKDGYVFRGWFTDSSFTQVFDFETDYEDDMTAYAGFYEIPETVYNDLKVIELVGAGTVSVQESGSNSTNPNYIYFSPKATGTYKMNYRISNNTGAWLIVRNVTTGNSYLEPFHIQNTTYDSINIEANAGDVILITTYSYNSNSAQFDCNFRDITSGNETTIVNPTCTAKCGSLVYDEKKIAGGNGAQITLIATAKEGYEFVAWMLLKPSESEYVQVSPSSSYNIGVNALSEGTYKAVFKVVE